MGVRLGGRGFREGGQMVVGHRSKIVAGSCGIGPVGGGENGARKGQGGASVWYLSPYLAPIPIQCPISLSGTPSQIRVPPGRIGDKKQH